jgi:glycosyltransferase involved in cell wall biosynthesis
MSKRRQRPKKTKTDPATSGHQSVFFGHQSAFLGHQSAGFWHESAPAAAAASFAASFPTARSAAASNGAARPIKVIHVGHYLIRAGIETWLKALLRGVDPDRLHFTRCVVTSPLNDPRVLREIPVPVEVGQEASVRRAAQDCDVLLVSGPAEVAQWLGTIRPRLCVLVAHGAAIWTRNILERCSPAIDHVIAVSQGVQRQVCNGFPSSVIYNGIDAAQLTRTAPRDEFRARFGFGPDDFVIGSVMRLAAEKHPEQLVEAIARLPRRFKLFLVGWGPWKQKLLDLANELAPLRCVIAGAAEHLGDYYRAFDAFCLPSESEGFGLATLEAMFCGVPVITTNTGFAPELLIDRVHYLQCTAAADSIVAGVQMLAHNPEWAAGLASQGRRAAEQFGFATRMCRQYEDLLTQLWNNRPQTPLPLGDGGRRGGRVRVCG